MSWGGGGDIASDMIKSFQKHVPGRWARMRLYYDLIKSLESQDWDDYCDLLGRDRAFDDIMKQIHPDHWEEQWAS